MKFIYLITVSSCSFIFQLIKQSHDCMGYLADALYFCISKTQRRGCISFDKTVDNTVHWLYWCTYITVKWWPSSDKNFHFNNATSRLNQNFHNLRRPTIRVRANSARFGILSLDSLVSVLRFSCRTGKWIVRKCLICLCAGK